MSTSTRCASADCWQAAAAGLAASAGWAGFPVERCTAAPCATSPPPPPPLRPSQAKGCIKVLNNGAGIPVEVHAKEGIYVPELIFGNLLTSSNYNDNEKKVRGVWLAGWRQGRHRASSWRSNRRQRWQPSRPCSPWPTPTSTNVQVTGGRNGYGAKLANIFSTKWVGGRQGRWLEAGAGEPVGRLSLPTHLCRRAPPAHRPPTARRRYVVETCDGKRKRRYKQTFTKNMSKKGEPQITWVGCCLAAGWRVHGVAVGGAAGCERGPCRVVPQHAAQRCPARPVPSPHPPLPRRSDCGSDENWTCITFYPDLGRFGMDELEEETVGSRQGGCGAASSGAHRRQHVALAPAT